MMAHLIATVALCATAVAQGPDSPGGIRPGRWVYTARAEYQGQLQDLGSRTVTVTTTTDDGNGAWLVATETTIDGQPAADSVAMRIQSLRPLFRHARTRGSQIDLTVPDSIVHGLLVEQKKVVPINLPLADRGFLSYDALRVALADWPLTTGWVRGASTLDLGGQPMFKPLKLKVTGEERLEVPAGRFDCWRIEVTGPGVDEQYWVSKNGHNLVRTREPLGSQGAVLFDLTLQVFTAGTDAVAQSAPPLVLEPDKYSYTFGVPTGWQHSFEVAGGLRAAGVRLLYFPEGGDFHTSNSIVYVNEPCPSERAGSLSACIDTVLQNAKRGNPNLKVEPAPSIATADGGKAKVRILSGASDPRQAREALAFVDHHQVVVLIVLTTKDPSTWKQDYAAFERIVSGHKYFDCNSPHLAVECSK